MLIDMQGKMSKIIGVVMALVVGLLLTAFLLPIAIDEVFGVDTSAWNQNVIDIWELLPVIGAIVLVLAFIGMAMKTYRT